jgi:hypothetical protein
MTTFPCYIGPKEGLLSVGVGGQLGPTVGLSIGCPRTFVLLYNLSPNTFTHIRCLRSIGSWGVWVGEFDFGLDWDMSH